MPCSSADMDFLEHNVHQWNMEEMELTRKSSTRRDTGLIKMMT